MSQYLSEAFKKLDTLNEETFSIDGNGLKEFEDFRDNDEVENFIDVVDMDATTEDELQDSYVGKVILDCCVCHSKQYKDVEDVVIEDEFANVGEECPFCYTADGFKVIGQVAPFGEEPEDEDDAPKSDEDEVESNPQTNEGLKRVKKGEAEEYKKVTFADVKKGDFVMDHPNDESAKPEKVIKIERDGDDIDLIFRNGNWSGSANSTCFVFNKADMKTRRANAKQYAKGSQDDYDWLSDEDGAYMKKKSGLKEAVNNVNVETDDSVVNVATDEGGKVTVTTEPKLSSAEAPDEGEMIVPVEPEVQDEIGSNVADGGEIELDLDEFDEESFDELGEGYLKKVYENVDSFKTSKVSSIKDSLVVEGLITFSSGSVKKTSFIFESKEVTKSGLVRFSGKNEQLARGKRAFTVTGRINDGKFLSEKFNYNYGVKNKFGKVQRLYGTVKR